MASIIKLLKGSFSLVILLSLFTHAGLAQVPSVVAANNFCYDPAAPIPISSFVSLDGDDASELPGIQIVISQNYDVNRDQLTYQNANGITGTFDAVNGVMTLTGTNTLAVYKQTIENVFFTTTTPPDRAIRSITISLSNLDFLPETGHFYQYIPQQSILWNPAKDAAESLTLFGLTGYLATITSKVESDFLIERVAGSAWIGATDEAQEGIWRWVTGPEGLENGGTGRPVTDDFVNWNDGEPNNCCGGEDFAHMMDWTSPPGRWNDLNNESAPVGSPYHPTGYMVEFGGMPGDPNITSNVTGVTVLDPLREINLTGPISICPNLQGVPYTVEDLPGYSYLWTVDGGIIASGQGTHEITVDWGATNPNARVAVRAVSDIVCELDAELPVIINVQLEPPLPNGPDDICYVDLGFTQIYSTPETPGSNYDWHITNGQILSGDGTNQIEVNWDPVPGTGTLYFTESTSTATDICDGNSPLLSVALRDPILSALSIVPVSCYNGADGTVTVDTDYQKGKAPFTYLWRTRGLGAIEDTRVTNLPAGDYSVDVNSDGCITTIPFTVPEPLELTGTINTRDVLCFGQATGEAEAVVIGGTGAYRYVWSVNRPQNLAAINGLPMGTYSVDVIDENDCVLTLNFSISEPPLLVIDSIASTLITCPEGADGTLEAFVSGGTPPYTYSWTGSDDFTSLATGFAKGNYQVTVTDANGCVTTATQDVEEATPKLYLPNAFTPNGDGENDTFGPKISCPFNFRMTIYNEWGNIVFITSANARYWDGTFKGQEAPIGKYSYTAAWNITVNDQLVSEERTGTFRLFR